MSKKKRQSQPAIKKPDPPKEPEAPVTQDKPFDFGGLPQRDLKKNLGCG